jgi:hypothetical protein
MSNNTTLRLMQIAKLFGLILFFSACTWLRAHVLPYDALVLDFTIEVLQVTAAVFTVQYFLDLLSDIFNKEV